MDEYTASLVEGYKYELRGALERGDKTHEAAVKAELDRIVPPPAKAKRETADAAPTETR